MYRFCGTIVQYEIFIQNIERPSERSCGPIIACSNQASMAAVRVGSGLSAPRSRASQMVAMPAHRLAVGIHPLRKKAAISDCELARGGFA